MKNNCILICFLVFQISFAQEKKLHGKILADGNLAEGINVVNLVNETSTLTDSKGEFQILAKEDDLLVFSSMNYEYKRKLISAENMESGNFSVEMIPKVNEIEVITIENYQNINAVSLGILQKPIKQLTPAERRLYTAGDFKPIHLLSILGGSLPLDPLINAINGRTKRLKKEIGIEKREHYLNELQLMFPDEYFTETLKIPSQYSKGFQLMAIEDEEFITILKSGNRTLSSIRLIQLSEIYKDLQANEK